MRAGRSRRDGVSAAAAPAGARGEAMALAPPVERVAGVRVALGDLGFETDWSGAYGVAHSHPPFSPRPPLFFRAGLRVI